MLRVFLPKAVPRKPKEKQAEKSVHLKKCTLFLSFCTVFAPKRQDSLPFERKRRDGEKEFFSRIYVVSLPREGALLPPRFHIGSHGRIFLLQSGFSRSGKGRAPPERNPMQGGHPLFFGAEVSSAGEKKTPLSFADRNEKDSDFSRKKEGNHLTIAFFFAILCKHPGCGAVGSARSLGACDRLTRQTLKVREISVFLAFPRFSAAVHFGKNF